MGQIRHYDLEGVNLDIPVRYDPRAGIHIEEYPDFMENPVWTSQGHPVMFAGEDACPHGESAEPDGCPDCAACKYYQALGEHTWIGVCRHEAKHKKETEQVETQEVVLIKEEQG